VGGGSAGGRRLHHHASGLGFPPRQQLSPPNEQGAQASRPRDRSAFTPLRRQGIHPQRTLLRAREGWSWRSAPLNSGADRAVRNPRRDQPHHLCGSGGQGQVRCEGSVARRRQPRGAAQAPCRHPPHRHRQAPHGRSDPAGARPAVGVSRPRLGGPGGQPGADHRGGRHGQDGPGGQVVPPALERGHHLRLVLLQPGHVGEPPDFVRPVLRRDPEVFPDHGGAHRIGLCQGRGAGRSPGQGAGAADSRWLRAVAGRRRRHEGLGAQSAAPGIGHAEQRAGRMHDARAHQRCPGRPASRAIH
jgi:hypothetical protein